MRRWSLRILVAVVVLLIVVIAVTQVVLSYSSIPDRIVLWQVQQELGLRMTAKSVDTGWFGTTEIKDVTLSLPLASDSLLATPVLHVRHTWLPKLLFTQKLVIDVLELEDAQLVVRQDEAGRWNLQDLVELLARTGGKQQAATTSNKRAGPKLPGVILHNGTVTVTDKAGRVAKLAPLEFSGLPDQAAPALVWRYDAKVGSTIKVIGQLSPGFEWAHQVEFEVNNAGDLLVPWVGKLAEPLNVAGRWEGELQNGQAVGRLTLTKAQALGGDMSGIVRARAGGGTARIEPEKLTIKTSQKLLPELQVASGTIELVGSTVRASRLAVSALNGMAQVDGRWAMEQSAGELVATWDDIAQPGGVKHSGRLSAAVTTTLGQPAVTADLASNGSVSGGRWKTQMNLNGGGRSWSDMTWVLSAPALSWSGPPRDVLLDGLVAHLTTRGKVLELTSVQLPTAERVSGKGRVDLNEQKWSLALAGRGWPVPKLAESTLEFRLDTGGDFKLYKLNELFLQTGDVQLWGTGFYDRAIPKPLDLNLKVRHAVATTPAPTTAEADPALRGTLYAEAHLNGIAWPVAMTIDGKVLGQGIRVKGRQIGDVTIDVSGNASPGQANLTSKEIDVLGGQWAMVGTWLGGTEDRIRLNVKVRDLPLAQCGEAIGRNDVTGVMDGSWTFDLPSFDRSRLTGNGDFEARDIHVGAFPVERATGKMTLRDGRIDAGPIELTQADGKATANLSLAVAAPKKPTVALTATNWPVDLPTAGAALRVTTDTKLDLDLAERRATGPMTASAKITLGSDPLGEAHVAADFAGHVATFRTIDATAFAGTASGSGRFDLDNPLGTTAQFRWRDIDSAAVAAIFPKLDGVAGRFGGSATLAPANDPRALEPLRLAVSLDSYGGSYRGATIGDGRLAAFMNYETGHENPGLGDRFRIVLSDTQDDPSVIRFADGVVSIWGRFGRHRGITTPAGQITLDLDRLDLNQLAHVANPKAKPMPGRVSGTITVVGPPRDPDRLFGTGTLRLTEADLGQAPVFDLLYSAMGKGADAGRGTVELRLEASTLYLDSIRYFSKGTEVRAQGAIREVYTYGDAPISMTAVGSVRPFSALKLPWMSDVDDVLNVLQSSVTSAVVDGKVGEPKIRLVPFSDLTDTMKSFIVGDVRAETQNR